MKLLLKLISTSFFVLLSIFCFSDSIKDWRKNIEIGDILYDPNGYVINPDGKIDLPFVDPVKTGHIGIYAGDIVYGGIIWPNQVIEATIIGGGVYMIGVEVWDYPATKEAWILKPKASPELKRKAVDFAMKQLGKRYTKLNFFSANPSPDNERWYCSELVWAAYLQEGKGIDLYSNDVWETNSPFNAAVSPQDIFFDNDIRRGEYHGFYYPVPEDAYRVFNTCSGKRYFSLGDALNDENFISGDIILIGPGGYLEHKSAVRKGVYLLADEFDEEKKIAKTVIHSVKSCFGVFTDLISSEDRPTVLSVESADVYIEGLTLTGAYGDNNVGGLILEEGSDNCRISNCIIFNNPFGIGLNQSSHSAISDNSFLYNSYDVGMFQSYGNEISHNLFLGSSEKSLVATEDESCCSSAYAIPDFNLKRELLPPLRELRDRKLSPLAVSSYYRFSPSVINLLSSDSELKQKAFSLISLWSPKIKSFFEKEEDFIITGKDAETTSLFLKELAEKTENIEEKSFFELLASEAKLAAEKNFSSAMLSSSLFEKGERIQKAKSENQKDATFIFLNDFSDNKDFLYSDYPSGSLFLYSKKELDYFFQGENFFGFLGNYWKEPALSFLDNNGNGVADSNFGSDSYPLMESEGSYVLKKEKRVEVEVSDWILY